MKVVILAGGDGIHLPGSGQTIAKGMVTTGGAPLLCHIMDHFSAYGYNEFIICAGKQQADIKKYFLDYYIHCNDVLVDLSNNSATIETGHKKQWKVCIVDTGLNTATGGRLKRIAHYIKDEPAIIVYSDVLADVNIAELIEAHQQGGKKATITVYNASQRFGVVELGKGNEVAGFMSRSEKSTSLINIGFAVIDPSVLDLINGDEVVFEKYPLEELARQNELNAYVHDGFFLKLDTLNDKTVLDHLFASGQINLKS